MELHDLVQRARQGDQAAFSEVCRRFEGLANKYAFQTHLAGIREDAKGEAMLAIVSAVRRYDAGSGAPFAGYVESKVKYAVWNLFKRERRRWQRECALEGGAEEEGGLLAVLPAGVDVAGEVENKLLACEILRELNRLPARQQQAVRRTLLADRRLADVACELKVSVQAVHNLRQRGINRLKQAITGM